MKALIEILVMLVVAAAIGYITAMIFYRNKQKEGADDGMDLSKALAERDQEIAQLKTQLAIKTRDEQVKKAPKAPAAAPAPTSAPVSQSAETKPAATPTPKTKAATTSSEKPKVESSKSTTASTKTDTSASKRESKDIVLQNIAAQRGSINFDRIGSSSPLEKDELQSIKGIGPFIEEKLNALGIYRFEQISKFNAEDIEQITKIVGSFPGRIERDDWVGQAKLKL